VALKETSLDLFGIACANDASIVAHLEFYGGSNKWNVRLLERLMIGRCMSFCLQGVVFS
jgi:hypothetical protein